MRKRKRQILKETHRQFKRAVVDLCKSQQGPKAILYAATIILILLGLNGLNIINSYVGRDFISAIEKKNLSQFQIQAILYGCVFIASSILGAWNNFTEGRLGILWREQLTWQITQAYMRHHTYYHLDDENGIQNPDQRIAEDVRAFTSTTLSFTLMIINGTLTAVSFSGVLWSISPRLFLVALAYSAFGTVCTIWLGKPLIRLNYHQLDLEANFRSDLIHVRENSEAIAISHREERFRNRLHLQLEHVVTNLRNIIRVSRNMACFTNSYNYFIQIIPALIIAPLFIKGNVEFGVITQSAMAFSALLGSLSLIVTQFGSISSFTAVTSRIRHLNEAIENAEPASRSTITYEHMPTHVSYAHVTLRKNEGSPALIEDLTLTFEPGSRWLVTSADEAAKIALFRATAGVWDCGEGHITTPGPEEILFLSERPYLPPLSIRHLLVRSANDDGTTEENIDDILAQLDLSDTIARVGGIDAKRDWDDVLSISEQHMLSVARIFLAKPTFVMLDRPGSSLPLPKLALILEMLRERHIGAVIFTNNGETALAYDHQLTIRLDGSWETQNSAAI